MPIESLVAAATLIRRFEQETLRLWTEGHVPGALHTCVGQEGPALGVTWWLDGADVVFSSHRCHGHYLARTGNVEGLMAEILGRATGVCGGRAGSQHVCDAAAHFFANGIVGGCVPAAAGVALAAEATNDAAIAVAFVGDGALGQGVVYETLNLAGRWSLPLLLVVEANGWAQSTRTDDALAGTLTGRAAAFGIESAEVHETSLVDAWRAGREAVNRVRRTRHPFVLVVHTLRLGPHSKGDDPPVRDEIEGPRAGDVLARDRRRLPAEIESAIESAVGKRVREATATALAAPEAKA